MKEKDMKSSNLGKQGIIWTTEINMIAECNWGLLLASGEDFTKDTH